MPGFDTMLTSDHLHRSLVWSEEWKETLKDLLQAMNYVDWLDEFPDGDTFNIPSIGDAVVNDFVENGTLEYNALDTGNFTFSITEYISSATTISNKAKQDMFKMERLVAAFMPKQRRALMERVEADILGLQSQQTAGNLNNINGAAHRFVAGDSTSVASRFVMETKDFAKAKFALNKANVPLSNLIAVVDPSVAFQLETATNLVNVSNNAQWEGIIETGITTGMRFIRNVYGFDVYESNYLANPGIETIGGNAVKVDSRANLFFSADMDIKPFVGAWRQQPTVDSEYDMDGQQDKYATIARYGVKLYRPENLVTVLTDTLDVVT